MAIKGEAEEFVLGLGVSVCWKVCPRAYDYRLVDAEAPKQDLFWLSYFEICRVILQYVVLYPQVVNLRLVGIDLFYEKFRSALDSFLIVLSLIKFFIVVEHCKL